MIEPPYSHSSLGIELSDDDQFSLPKAGPPACALHA